MRAMMVVNHGVVKEDEMIGHIDITPSWWAETAHGGAYEARRARVSTLGPIHASWAEDPRLRDLMLQVDGWVHGDQGFYAAPKEDAALDVVAFRAAMLERLEAPEVRRAVVEAVEKARVQEGGA